APRHARLVGGPRVVEPARARRRGAHGPRRRAAGQSRARGRLHALPAHSERPSARLRRLADGDVEVPVAERPTYSLPMRALCVVVASLLVGCSGVVSEDPDAATPSDDAGAPSDAGSGADSGTMSDGGAASDAGSES